MLSSFRRHSLMKFQRVKIFFERMSKKLTDFAQFLLRCDASVALACEKSQKLKNVALYKNLIDFLEKNISYELGKGVKCHLFGSRMIGLGTDDSDLDIYLEIGKENLQKRDSNFDTQI
jgi:DNA polymerase sigma